jgi:hypothetical protein
VTSRDLVAVANAAAMTASTIPGGAGLPALEVYCMLVKVEPWPDGFETRARESGRAQCANVSGLTPISDYVAIIVDEHGRREHPSARPRERVGFGVHARSRTSSGCGTAKGVAGARPHLRGSARERQARTSELRFAAGR